MKWAIVLEAMHGAAKGRQFETTEEGDNSFTAMERARKAAQKSGVMEACRRFEVVVCVREDQAARVHILQARCMQHGSPCVPLTDDVVQKRERLAKMTVCRTPTDQQTIKAISETGKAALLQTTKNLASRGIRITDDSFGASLGEHLMNQRNKVK
jgi:hypothetical protein